MTSKIESMLWEYKSNKAEINMLTFRLDLNAIDYSKDSVQTSNISSLDNIVIAREKKLIKLKESVADVEALINSLGDKHKKIIVDFYFKRRTNPQIATDLGYSTEDGVKKEKKKALIRMSEIYNRINEELGEV